MKEEGKNLMTEIQETVTLKNVIKPPKAKAPAPAIDMQMLQERIRAKAYELYEERGCIHGHEQEDWFEAERLVMSELRSAGI